MLLMMVEKNEPIHSIVYCDMGEWEFPEMHRHISKLKSALSVPFVRVHPKHDLTYMLIEKPVKKKGIIYRKGNNWPSAIRRWCTREKVAAIDRYVRNITDDVTVCIGYAIDEQKRVKPNNKKKFRYPLIEYGMTGKDAIEYCYQKGFDFEGLYKLFDRASCFCCPLQKIGELKNLRKYKPSLWKKMLTWDKRIDTRFGVGFYGYKTVWDMEKRFLEEDRQLCLFPDIDKENSFKLS